MPVIRYRSKDIAALIYWEPTFAKCDTGIDLINRNLKSDIIFREGIYTFSRVNVPHTPYNALTGRIHAIPIQTNQLIPDLLFSKAQNRPSLLTISAIGAT